MNIFKDLTTGVVGTFLKVFIAPLPVTFVAIVIFSTIQAAVFAHILVLIIFYVNSPLRKKKYEPGNFSQFINMLIRTYCAFYVGIALYYGMTGVTYLAGLTDWRGSFITIVVTIIGFMTTVDFFFNIIFQFVTPPPSDVIRGTQVRGGDDLPDFMPPPPGGIGD